MFIRNSAKMIFLTALVLSVMVMSAIAQQPTPVDIRPLVLGQPIERELKSDEAHSYSIALQAGQFLNVVVEQKGIDVVVTLFDANNKNMAEVDSPNESLGPESLFFVSTITESYRLEVRPAEKKVGSGRYEARIAKLATATDKDKEYVAANAAGNKAFIEAEALFDDGKAESLRRAIKKYEESLPYFRATENRFMEGVATSNIGQVHDELGEKTLALKFLSESLPLSRAVGNRLGESYTLNVMGSVYSDLGEKQTALKYLNESLQLRRVLGDKTAIANTLNNIGTVYRDLGDRREALKYYNEAMALYRAVGNKSSEAGTLNNLGIIYSDLGEKQEALRFYNESLPLRRAVGDKRGEASTLYSIGRVYSDLGEKPTALEYYSQALVIRRASGDKNGEGESLNSIGRVYAEQGETQKALEYYSQALAIRRTVGNRVGEATSLNNIGALYRELGEKQEALKYYNESLTIRRAVGDKQGEASSLNNIGGVYQDLGKNQEALKFYNESLPLHRSVGNKAGEAATLNNIGGVYLNLRQRPDALKFFAESLLLYQAIGSKAGEANTLMNIGGVHDTFGEYTQALKFFTESLGLSRVAGSKSLEAKTLANISYSWRKSGNGRISVFFGKLAVSDFEILRSNVAGLDKNTQQTFLKSNETVYRRLSNALLDQKRFAEAQQVLNIFKDQQYFDFKSQQQSASLSLTKRESDLTTAFDKKLDVVVAAIRSLDAFKRGIGQRSPTGAEADEIKAKEKSVQTAKEDYQAFLKDAERQFAVAPDEKDKVPDTVDLQTMKSSLRETSIATKKNTVAIYTLVGEDNYRALVVTADDVFAVEAAVKAVDLNKKASQLWSLLRSPKYDPQPAANELYKIVFAPIEAKLPKGTKTILWSLDGNLRYIPMAALHDGKKYLAERYENVIFTRADKERMTRAVNPALSGTGLGSSEAHTVDLAGEKFNAAALPSVKSELGRIFMGKDSSGILTGSVLLDAKFTRAAMLSELKVRRPLVHIASHFKFEPGDEARSFLLLGDGTPFTLDEMKQQTDLFSGVDLLTLSACQTAAQRPDANGREVDGFAELAQRLGAGAVMASLWEVSDNSTAELMTRFYKAYRGAKPTTKSDALRRAQLALLTGSYKTVATGDRELTRKNTEPEISDVATKLFKPDRKAPFAHPFYWSPFILIGNWK